MGPVTILESILCAPDELNGLPPNVIHELMTVNRVCIDADPIIIQLVKLRRWKYFEPRFNGKSILSYASFLDQTDRERNTILHLLVAQLDVVAPNQYNRLVAIVERVLLTAAERAGGLFFVNRTNRDEETALHLLVTNRKPESAKLVEQFKRCRAIVAFPDAFGNSALHISGIIRSSHMIRALLALTPPIDLMMANWDGRTAYRTIFEHYAVCSESVFATGIERFSSQKQQRGTPPDRRVILDWAKSVYTPEKAEVIADQLLLYFSGLAGDKAARRRALLEIIDVDGKELLETKTTH